MSDFCWSEHTHLYIVYYGVCFEFDVQFHQVNRVCRVTELNRAFCARNPHREKCNAWLQEPYQLHWNSRERENWPFSPALQTLFAAWLCYENFPTGNTKNEKLLFSGYIQRFNSRKFAIIPIREFKRWWKDFFIDQHFNWVKKNVALKCNSAIAVEKIQIASILLISIVRCFFN